MHAKDCGIVSFPPMYLSMVGYCTHISATSFDRRRTCATDLADGPHKAYAVSDIVVVPVGSIERVGGNAFFHPLYHCREDIVLWFIR